jgi:hypothetical protein
MGIFRLIHLEETLFMHLDNHRVVALPLTLDETILFPPRQLIFNERHPDDRSRDHLVLVINVARVFGTDAEIISPATHS